jgi:1,4-dihydroxy-6-naphthoate synthase
MMRIGISTCPNDTFSFAALLEGRVPAPEALQWTLEDVQDLNELLMQRELDVGKASFHAAIVLADDYLVLPVGAALGFGVGPLLLAKDAAHAARLPQVGDRVLCPGALTTATLLYKLFVPEGPRAAQRLFSEIMPALERGDAEYGVVIHEGRFTYEQHGLHRALDLGQLWEERCGCALPLGGILARRALGPERIAAITDAIRASLDVAREDPRSSLPAMRRYAQEFSDEVLEEHVRLYVNDATTELGEEGRRALEQLQARARELGILGGSLF